MIRAILLALCLMWIVPAQAQEAVIGSGVRGAGGPSFGPAGPGDVVSGAKLLFGLRGMTSAYATGRNPGVTVRRTSDNTTQNINILNSGNLDIATANSFAGTDATATCSITNATATCSSASSTPNVHDTITGTGVTQPCFVTAVGTFTGGAGTLTVSGGPTGGAAAPCGTVASTTFTFQYGLFVSKLWDQSGNGTDCFNGAINVTCEAVNATAANQPQLLPLCPTLPCMYANTGVSAMVLITQEVVAGSALPVSFEGVYDRIGTGGATELLYQVANGIAMGGSTTAGDAHSSNNGGSADFAASDNTNHVIQLVFNSTASTSVGNVDGTDVSTTLNPGTSAQIAGQNVYIANYSGQNLPFNGYFYELGEWYLGFSSGQRTSLCHNARLYWGTPGSC